MTSIAESLENLDSDEQILDSQHIYLLLIEISTIAYSLELNKKCVLGK